jgi:hypothetical protein
MFAKIRLYLFQLRMLLADFSNPLSLERRFFGSFLADAGKK